MAERSVIFCVGAQDLDLIRIDIEPDLPGGDLHRAFSSPSGGLSTIPAGISSSFAARLKRSLSVRVHLRREYSRSSSWCATRTKT